MSMYPKNMFFTSESVTEGHPDKFCDQISDAVLDECLKIDPLSRVACECYVTMGLLNVGGEITAKDGFLLDVRHPMELAVENMPEAVNIQLGELRSRLDELPRDQEINVFCRSGQRSYYATRILLQNGFKVRNVSGGMLSFAHNYLLDIKKEG